MKVKRVKREKVRVGLFMGQELHKNVSKECKKFNNKNGLDLTVNRYILKILGEMIEKETEIEAEIENLRPYLEEQ